MKDLCLGMGDDGAKTSVLGKHLLSYCSMMAYLPKDVVTHPLTSALKH